MSVFLCFSCVANNDSIIVSRKPHEEGSEGWKQRREEGREKAGGDERKRGIKGNEEREKEVLGVTKKRKLKGIY